jgi:predicted ATPase
MLAGVLHERGRIDEARAVVTTGLELGAQTGLRYWDAELHRLRGTRALADSRAADDDAAREADGCFATALEIARGQSARFLELRAATSRARLWRDRGARREAHALLVDVVAAFPAGTDTLDVTEARALLAEVAGSG